ncbi:MAG: hypothetical protein WCK63_05395 [Betaproteobacteria bacterium]
MLSIATGVNYKGSLLVYATFTLLTNVLLFNGWKSKAIYFDTFVGVFLWLGFWLKFSLRVVFSEGVFREPVGAFDGSAAAFDHALLVASCGIAGLVVASFVRERFFVYPNEPHSCAHSGLFLFYRIFRKYFVAVFLVVVFLVATSNAWLAIYQRGMVAQTVLPFGLNGVFKWLLQFGLASVAALIVRFEIEINRNLSLMAVFPAILEGLFSNVSLLSRGMILNLSALAIGSLRMIRAMKLSPNRLSMFVAATVFVGLFSVSVASVNILRAQMFDKSEPATVASAVASVSHISQPLFVDRWVGIEGAMAVSASDKLGWELWQRAWRERYDESEFSLYDRSFVSAHYASSDINQSRNHFVNLPGLIAFLYYPGSFAFLFLAMVFAGLVGAVLEIATFRFCGRNWILCSLFAQVIAFRYASFGYVPGQSYLLFGTLVLNGFLIFAVDFLLRKWVFGRPEVT